MTKEQILPVVGYEGLYLISSTGDVYSMPKKWISGKGCPREIKEIKKMSASLDNSGYKVVGLRRDGKTKAYKVHRLVAMAFISNPQNKPYVNHKDGDKGNCNVNNLEWVTAKENSTHASLTGLLKNVSGEDHGMCKLSKEYVLYIKSSNLSSKELGNMFSVSHYHINAIRRGEKWAKVI